MDQTRILIVEDNLEYGLFLKALVHSEAEVSVSTNLKDARTYLEKQIPNLLLLDISMGSENGFEFCAELKASERWREIPVVFLTAKEATIDKVTGFSLGADDYIVKASDPLEIQARIRAILRRGASKFKRELFSLSGIKLNLTLQRTFIEESPGKDVSIELTPTEFKILGLLMRNEGKVFSRRRLMEEIFGQPSGTGRTVDTHVHSLRKKMKIHGNKVESVFGAGYRFRSNPDINYV